MYIAFYVSSHGFGHMTRCLALIEEILSKSEHNIYLACQKTQNDFAKKYLDRFKGRVVHSDLNTDIGLINREKSLQVDKDAMETNIQDFINSWDHLVSNEVNKLANIKPEIFVTDISPIEILVAKKLNKKAIGISNFTWFNQYSHIGLSNSIITTFKEVYEKLDLFINYKLHLDTEHLNCNTDPAGLVCRKLDPSRIKDIRSECGHSIFISCGKSAELKKIHLKNYNGTVFYTEGISIESDSKLVKLPHNTLDTQNYMAACDAAIIKAGWGSIAEGLIGHTQLLLIEREGVLEDSFMIELLKSEKLAASIREDQLQKLNFTEISKRLGHIDTNKLQATKNDLNSVVSKILNIV